MTTRDTLNLLELSYDLIEEILSRVPTASLVRLRFTCKRWNALLKDPKFIEKQSVKAPKQHSVLMSSKSKVYTMSLNLNEIRKNSYDPSKLLNLSLKDFHNSKQVEVDGFSHCDGLLLIYPTKDRRKVVVSNPCTGQTRWIQCNDDRYMRRFALGYKSNKYCGQSYKILRYNLRSSYHRYRRVVEYEVYDFSSTSWSVRKAFTPNLRIDPNPNGVSLKGNTYWIALEEDGERVLLSFDFSTESFNWLPKRFPDFGHDLNAMALSIVGEEYLSVLYKKWSDRPRIEIWLTRDVEIDESKVWPWSKLLSVDINEDMWLFSTSFFIDEEKKALVLCKNKLNQCIETEMIYIFGEDKQCIEISLGEYRFLSYKPPFVVRYVPSLVHIP